jgi:hypothetical protein
MVSTNSIDTQVVPFDYAITQLIPTDFIAPHTKQSIYHTIQLSDCPN